MQLTPQEYLACAASLRVTCFVAPSPELTPSAGNRKIETSTRRASAWWDAIVSHTPRLEAAGGVPPPLLAPVGGPHSASAYGGGTTAALQRGAAGIVLASLGMGEKESFRQDAMVAAVAAARAADASNCPVLLPGALGPWEVLQGVAAGVDVVDSSFPVDCTEETVALSFRYWMPSWPQPSPPAAGAAPSPVQLVQAAQHALTGNGTKDAMVDAGHTVTGAAHPASAAPGGVAGAVPAHGCHSNHAPAAFSKESVAEAALDSHCTRRNAVSPAVATSHEPLVPGCSCYTCRTHTAGYVRHLLNTSEMLGPELLQAHNVHHWLQFAGAVRKAVAAGQLHEYIAWFVGENGGSVLTQQGAVSHCGAASEFNEDSSWVQ